MNTSKNGFPRARHVRPDAIPSVKAILASFDKWKTQAEATSADGSVLLYEEYYYYVDPQGHAHEVTRDELEGDDGGQLLPGTYEIHVKDSNGADLVHPWKGQHLSGESLSSRMHEPAALYSTIVHDSETYIRAQAGRLARAEKSEREARDELRIVREHNANLQREIGGKTIAAERALAEKEVAEARQKDAEERLRELEESISECRPHVAMLVDNLIDRAGQYFGLPTLAANNSDTGQRGSVAQEDPFGLPPETQWEPAPPGADNPAARGVSLFSLVVNPRSLRWIVESRLLSWGECRALFWLARRRNLPEFWEDWLAMWEDCCAAWDEANGVEYGHEPFAGAAE
jgi:hypothetical protein